MPKKFLAAGAVLAGLAVILGAFGAHGLEQLTTDQKILHGFQTATQYQFYHALALLATGLLAIHNADRWLKVAGYCFITGCILFSGSLYLLTFLNIQGSSMVRFVGPVTPLGGLFFIAAWLFMLLAILRAKAWERPTGAV